MSEEEKINMEDATNGHKQEEERRWQEEMKVAADDLVDTVKDLIAESNVRRVVVRDSGGRDLLNIPVWIGIAGVALAPVYASLALIAGMVTRCSIIVERQEPAAS